MPDATTRDDFVLTFGRDPNTGLTRLRNGAVVLRCTCADQHCRGWAMASPQDLDAGFFRPTPEELAEATTHRATLLATPHQYPTALAADGPILNPDCREGKHKACRGDAWDNVLDEPADCGCECHR